MNTKLEFNLSDAALEELTKESKGDCTMIEEKKEEYKKKVLDAAEQRRDFVTLEDGFVYYFPDYCGALSAESLRILADELDKRNESYNKSIEDYFRNNA